jgi:ArsR family transcriptional regulator
VYGEWLERFRALGDETRLKILRLLSVRDACVCELVELLPVSQPAVSQHLSKLRRAGLVDEYRQSRWTFYRLNADMPREVAAVLAELPVDRSAAVWLTTHAVSSGCQASGTPIPPQATAVPVSLARHDS